MFISESAVLRLFSESELTSVYTDSSSISGPESNARFFLSGPVRRAETVNILGRF